MSFIYNCAVYLAIFFLKIAAFFSPKLKLFVAGRKNVFTFLKNTIANETNIIWLHTASLGEFEQGLPVIEKLKSTYPNYKILVTFFSPSGYEVKKNSTSADFITYLPLDTKRNAEKFVEIVHPKLVIFVKYEIWPNYLSTLKNKKIPTLLISALFNKKQIYFKGYGAFMRNSLSAFTHFFVQDAHSKNLLSTLGYNNTSVSGDTRFDRVLEILQRDNHLDFIEKFKENNFCIVAGSTWPEDEAILVDYINTTNESIKLILAPHTIKPDNIKKLAAAIQKKTVLYSEHDNQNLSEFDVFIIDTIGMLTKIYSYAEIAYVGGGFSTGLHNTLEPAVFGIPVIIGPKYSGFKEAEELVEKNGIISISDAKTFKIKMQEFLNSNDLYKITSEVNRHYIAENKGATAQIMQFIHSLIVK